MATSTSPDVDMVSSNFPSTSSKPERLPVTVTKPSPYTFSLSHLLAVDPNPLSSSTELRSSPTALSSLARDGAQSLINQILLTCPIASTPAGVLVNLPIPPADSTHVLPRLKPLPKPQTPTKWEQFARKKGIGKFSSNLSSSKANTTGKMVYDPETQEWVPKWGYKGKNKQADNEWLVELDDKLEKKEHDFEQRGKGETIRGEGRRERKEKVRRQERKMRANERRATKGRSS
ncbi:putative ribosome biogenesis protein [Phaeomoniella chlamydospora]|uniref:Ribosome biogenesis regulatory protein n=1 Tax=Phaeomoniella chlamydospora TaxID=158046 RepID=A0A0G2F176_PHACM|nr:putative ribosome biogenesis protein [Phaeomoniella chlamydospora]